MTLKRALMVTLTLAMTGALLYFLPVIAQEDPGKETADRGKTGIGCAKKASAASGTIAGLTEPEQKVVNYLAERIVEDGSIQFSADQIEEDTGVSTDEIRLSVIQPAVIAELQRRNFDLSSIIGGSYCSKFSACSVDRNLSNASGEELARYQEERSKDGTTFTEWIAPDFELPTTEGEKVALSDYRGKNVALVFLSGHCYHSLDTLPILADLREKYGSQDLEILPVFVNSGSPEVVKSRAWEMDIDYPLLVSESKDISKAYESRMVPSTFLIDEEGRITKKLVGFKNKAVLDEAVAELISS